MSLQRRQFLRMGGAAAALAMLPRFGLAATADADTRLLVVLLRGGMDGLHAVQAIGDPAWAGLRARFAGAPGQPAATPLDADFALHGRFEFAAGLYARRQLLPVVAVAPPYRQRSHFEAQDCVENGMAGSGGNTGWMSRCVAAVPGAKGLAVASVMPLAMRGTGAVASWSPPLPVAPDRLLMQQLQALYAADPELGPLFSGQAAVSDGDLSSRGGLRLPQAMAAAARFMSEPDGPRIGFVEDTGWDTHNNALGVLDRKFGELDAALRTFHDGASAIWPRTVVAVVTEFGRTAAINGTGGSDHGTGGVALLAGGAVAGGRVAGDWPGLAPQQLNDQRDVRATTDLRSVFKGILADHLGITVDVLGRRVFPDSGTVAPLRGLLRAG